MSDFDFTLGWEGASGPNGPWAHLQVVQFTGHEPMTGLYRFDIMVVAKLPAPEIDTQEIVQTRATLRIKTKTDPGYRVIHGIISEAQELFQTSDGMLYRLILRPPLARAKYRTRCRIFLEKTLRQIIDTVLTDDPNLTRLDGDSVEPDSGEMNTYTTATEHFAWRISNSPRIDLTTSRPFCVQYNESDYAFVARLLEDEGIGFHYENGLDKCLLVLSDQDAGRSRLAPALPIGPGIAFRDMNQIQLGGRIRPQLVSLDDYNWKNPVVDMLAQASDVPAAIASSTPFFHYQYPGGYPDSPAQGQQLAERRAERYHTEADFAEGEASTRVLFAGCIYSVQHPKPRYDGEYLCTSVDTVANQPGVLTTQIPGVGNTPFTSTFKALRRGKDGQVAESLYRPARSTPRPRIVGSQTAFVTNEPNSKDAVVHVGDQVGSVRLKFHWDRDTARLAKEPSSNWVRVSHYMAGAGMGAVYHPRVGDEVVVEFLEGDPDHPIVTGRVYNGARIPPVDAMGQATVSTIKTFSIPGGKQYNEYLFQDADGREEIKQHAARDWLSQTEHDRTETINNDSTSTVKSNRTESTKGNRSTTVSTNNTETVAANETIKIGANQMITIGVNQAENIGGAQSLMVTGPQSYSLLGGQSFDVTGAQSFSIDGAQSFTVTGPQTFSITGAQTTTIGATASTHSTGAMSITTGASQTIQAATNQSIDAGSNQSLSSTTLHVNASSSMSVHTASLKESASSMELSASGHYTLSGGSIDLTSKGTVTIHGGTINVSGGTVNIHGSGVKVTSGGAVDVTAGATIAAKAGVIKLN